MPLPPENDSRFELSQYITGDFKLSMWIPADLAGRVVGKKGVVITNIQRETRAKLVNALSPVGDSLWIAVVIIGDWKSVCAAYKAVSDIVSGEVDDVVLEFVLHSRKQLFVTKRGNSEILKHISAKFSVRIYFPESGKESNVAHPDPVTLEGSFESIRSAIAFIETEGQNDLENRYRLSDVVSTMEQRETDRYHNQSSLGEDTEKEKPSSVAARPESKHSHMRTIDIPLNLVGLLLSRKPQLKVSILNQIQGVTGTIISKILPPESASGEAVATESMTASPEVSTANNEPTVDKTLDKEVNVTEVEASNQYVPFKILGYHSENIDMAYDHLQRIIRGERIKDVLEALKVVSKNLQRPARSERISSRPKVKKS